MEENRFTQDLNRRYVEFGRKYAPQEEPQRPWPERAQSKYQANMRRRREPTWPVTVTLCIQEEEEALRGGRKCDLWSGSRPPPVCGGGNVAGKQVALVRGSVVPDWESDAGIGQTRLAPTQV